MKAMIINQYGSAGAFEVADIPKPSVKAGHILVKIAGFLVF